ncbi:MAG: hypothetical protein JWL83_2823 [Actinomycetia bacterium]|nr:hypothetical protein [Actinomycetes bacterium]
MPDVESALLSAVLGFGRSRLDALLTSLAADAESLLLTLLPGASQALRDKVNAPPIAAAVATDLAAAGSHLSALGVDLGAPPQTLSDVQGAFGELAAAVNSVHDAITQIRTVVPEVGTAEDALVRAVKKAVATVGDDVSGLVSQLGLGGAGTKISDGLNANGTTIRYELANAAERSVAGPPGASLTLANSTVAAILDYGALPPSLGLSVTTGLGAGLVADGFVAQLLGTADAAASVTLTIGLDTSKGLTFQAGVKHRIDLPGSLSVPGVELHSLGLEIPIDGPLTFELTGTLSGALGPIAAVVEGAGIALTIDPNKLLGGQQPASLSLHPPSGAGLSVDAGLVRGGGYLSSKNGEYGGALDLRLGPIEIKAVGLLGTDPFSLVLVLSVEFMPPIQLSFGFTLNAVGGVLALERTVATDALRAGIHDHTADTVLFPKDPVAAAPTILGLLRAIFPPQPGGFVVGPLLELGWGAPVSYVTARLGVIISLPDPKVILIGSVRVAVPLPDAAIVDLHADLYGEITPDHILFLVSLSGSRVAGFSLAGDFGLLIGFGDNPDFAFSAGGFHPHYPPPGELAGMRRVSVDISPPALVTMRAEAYLALTSNSFQLGCRVEMKAEVAGVGAEGHLGFDALVRWAPRFMFEIDLYAGVSLYAFGESFASVDLRLHLEGPGPWIAHGTASVSVLFFDVDFELGPITWGDGDNPPADPVSPQDLVREKLSLAGAWSARLPPGTDTLVRLVDLGALGDVVVHPLGALEARQPAVPLETTIDRVGRNPVTVPRVNLGAPTVGGLAAKAVSSAMDRFAPGEFLNLTDDQKLSRPGFEEFPSGVVIVGADTDQFGTPSATSYQWDTVFPPKKLPRLKMAYTSLTAVHAALLGAGPAGKAIVANTNPYAAETEPVAFAAGSQTRVRSVRDLSAIDGVPIGPMTTTEAARVVADLGATAQYVGAGVGT